MTIYWMNHEPDRWKADGLHVRDRNGCLVMRCESRAEALARVHSHNQGGAEETSSYDLEPSGILTYI